MYRLKNGGNDRFLFRVILILAKIKKKKKKKKKNTFPMEALNEIWLKLGEREQIYFTEIFYITSKWRPKHFLYCEIMLIYAN